MPIDIIAAGNPVTDVKVNEIIAAINALQGVAGTPIVWDFQTGTNTLTVTLTPGNWIVNASAGIYASVFNSMTLSIDGDVVCTTPGGGDTDGVNLNPLGGIALIEITTERDVDIVTAGGDTVIFLKVMCHRTI